MKIMEEECDRVEFVSPSSGRLDVLLTEFLRKFSKWEFSRTRVAALIKDGKVLCKGKKVTAPGAVISSGDVFVFLLPEREDTHLLGDGSVKFDVVWEDDHLLVIEKPRDLVIHPGAGVKGKTLVHGLVHYLGDDLPLIGNSLRPGIVHRLDKDTTGLMLVAKSKEAFANLIDQFKGGKKIKRDYMVLLCPFSRRLQHTFLNDENRGIIDLPIGRSPLHRVKMAVDGIKAKNALTYWRVERQFSEGALLRVQLATGRTHQIRVHMAHMGSPVVADPLYSSFGFIANSQCRKAAKIFARQALHSCRLVFLHPITSKKMIFESHLPEDMSELISAFQRIS